MAGKKKVKSGRLTVVNADCAGVDVGKSYHYVAVDPERFENPVRKFGSFTSDLGALAQWLSACGAGQISSCVGFVGRLLGRRVSVGFRIG